MTGALVLTCPSCGRRGKGAARAVVAETEHDLGALAQGARVSHVFTIKNTGDAVLKIERAELSPGITVRFKPEVAAGAEGKITMELPTELFGGDAEAAGQFRLNDPATPRLTLTLKAHVIQPIEVLPLPAAFLSVFRGEAGERVLTVKSNLGRPLAITRLELLGTHFEATIAADSPGRNYQLRVSVPAGTTPGRFEEAVILHTDDADRPTVRVPVNVLVKTEVYANPETVDFGRIRRRDLAADPRMADLLAQTVIVQRKEGSFELRSVVSDLPAVAATRTPEGASQIFEIVLRPLPGALTPGKLDGTVRVTTDDPRFPELAIPVHGDVE